MGDDQSAKTPVDGVATHSQPIDEPLDPSGIAQYVEHDRCPRYLKQRVDPGDEPDAREWREAYGLMNIALLGNGKEFEAQQVEALAANATKIISPDLGDRSNADTPDISVDETWRETTEGRIDQLTTALDDAAALSPTAAGDQPYILCYQAPLGGQIGSQDVWGEVDCLVLAPATAAPDNEPSSQQDGSSQADSEATTVQTQPNTNDAEVVARVLDIKSASEQQPSHRVQVAVYSALFDQLLTDKPTPPCRIETSVLTQETAATTGGSLHPLDLPTYSRQEWQLFVRRLLAADGPIDTALNDELGELPFSIDRVCDNCAYKEACATRAVEDPTAPSSLALLGFGTTSQTALENAGVSNIRELSALLPRQAGYHPSDDPPTVDIQPDQQQALEQALSEPIYETVQRAQALRGKLDPEYDAYSRPPLIPGKDWVPLPDDRRDDWSNIESANDGELIHVALFVRPDTAINRIGALGACIYAEAHDEYITVGEVIDAIPDDPELASDVESSLLERFLEQVFEAVESVAEALGEPEQSVIHCYTFTENEADTLADGLERHTDNLPKARAMRALCSLHEDGHVGFDQSMLSEVQSILTEHFALTYPSQGLLSIAEQFVPGWTIEAFDPLDARENTPPLRAIFHEQLLNNRVPYIADDPGISLHLAPGRLGEETNGGDSNTGTAIPDGWYPIRKRAGAQFPLEYIWAVTPRQPGDDTPRLTPESVDEWSLDDDKEDHYKREIGRFYYRTYDHEEPLQRSDVEYLAERLSYALMRVVEAVPYKDAYHPKEPLDATSLSEFDLPVTRLPEAARDYLRIEFGTQRDNILDHYSQPLRKRARSGRSIPIRCTDIDQQGDGSLTISAELAYDVLFDDAERADQVARQARLRSGDGPGSGSWRLLTRLQSVSSTGNDNGDTLETIDAQSATDGADSPREDTTTSNTDAVSNSTTNPDTDADSSSSPTLRVDDTESIKHSPPVLVEDIDTKAGEISLTTFSHRFRCHGSEFRVDHCGWHSPTAGNVDDPQEPPSERPGYVADREPVWIDTDEVYMLDPMIDDFGAPKADLAVRRDTVAQNALWQQLQAIRQTGRQQASMVANPDRIDEYLDRLAGADEYLEPNNDQKAFIRAVDRALVPLQGPPGTGKTSGATAPALLARVYANSEHDQPFAGIVTAPSHEAVDTVLESVVNCLDSWRQEFSGFSDLTLLRVLPSTPPATGNRPDAAAAEVNVSYVNYHSSAGNSTLQRTAEDIWESPDEPTQCLLFATPATLYRSLGVIADQLSAVDGDTAPAAMRHAEGLFDIVCADEASMLDMPQLLLAGSALKPAGQTLLVGDHRQLPTVTETDWEDSLRQPLTESKAYLSALEYVRWLNETISTGDADAADPSTNTHQTELSGFEQIPTDSSGSDGQ